MKKFIPIILAISLFMAFLPLTEKKVRAQSPYLRVIDESTPFFSNSFSSTPLFYLPYTYYVKVLGESGEFYHVEYGGENNTNSIDGFVPKNLLYKDDLSAQFRYPNISITTANNTLLYLDSSLTTSSQHIFSGRELTYYGKFLSPDGSNIYFVGYHDRLGYVKESDVIPFTISNHPNPLTFIPPIEEPSPDEDVLLPEKENSSTQSNIRFIIIACLVFAGLIGLFIALKNKPTSQHQTYYDENDYE